MMTPEHLKISRSAEAKAWPATALVAIAGGMSFAEFQKLVAGPRPGGRAGVAQIDAKSSAAVIDAGEVYARRKAATRRGGPRGESK